MRFTPFVLAALSVLISTDATPIKQRRQYDGENVSNQLSDGTPCRAITIIFARGTFEGGNIGAVVGPAFAQRLVNDTSESQVALQGVDYNANVTGFLAGGDPVGSATMAQLVEKAATQCPNTNLVMSGYSQGAQLVHNAASQLDACTASFVSSVVMFGDPKQDQAVAQIDQSKVLKICHSSDDICHGGVSITSSHLNYSEDVGQASMFVRGHAVGLT